MAKCDDSNGCTADIWDAAKGCVHAALADATPCDDGDACSVNDVCQAGGCKVGPPKACAAAEACEGGACKPGFLLIPAGSFKMGCVASDSTCEADEKPQHTVALDAFYIDVFEVSVAKYKSCVDAGKCTAPSGNWSFCNWGVVGKGQHPVNCVNWSQADSFCKWVDAKGHLPTEAQWEKAARGGIEGAIFAWGDKLDCDHAVWESSAIGKGCNGQGTKPVGSKPLGKNTYGLFDMTGNLREWTADWYNDAYYSGSAPANPLGAASGSSRVWRGGSFADWGLAGCGCPHATGMARPSRTTLLVSAVPDRCREAGFGLSFGGDDSGSSCVAGRAVARLAGVSSRPRRLAAPPKVGTNWFSVCPLVTSPPRRPCAG